MGSVTCSHLLKNRGDCIATMSNQLAIATCPNFFATMSIQLGIAKCPNQLKNQLVHVLATMSTLGIANRSNQLMHHLVGRYSNPTNHTGSFAKPTFVPMDLEEPATLHWSGRGNIFSVIATVTVKQLEFA